MNSETVATHMHLHKWYRGDTNIWNTRQIKFWLKHRACVMDWYRKTKATGWISDGQEGILSFFSIIIVTRKSKT